MPGLNPLETELTTAATDLLLGGLSLLLMVRLLLLAVTDRRKRGYWAAMFGALAVASLLGAVAHGLDLSAATREALWQPLYLSLGLVIAFFVLGSLHDLKGEPLSRPLTPWLLAVAVGFYLLTRFLSGSFLLFILYEAAGMLTALSIYLFLFFSRRQPGAGFMCTGIAVTMVAAVVQAMAGARLHLIFEFDHNGLVHLIQLPGVLLIYQGLAVSVIKRS